jgi:hypothetical protein
LQDAFSWDAGLARILSDALPDNPVGVEKELVTWFKTPSS